MINWIELGEIWADAETKPPPLLNVPKERFKNQADCHRYETERHNLARGKSHHREKQNCRRKAHQNRPCSAEWYLVWPLSCWVLEPQLQKCCKLHYHPEAVEEVLRRHDLLEAHPREEHHSRG
ncbi:hypothetical protein SAY86_009347 [Trapa natans]|uniref:Uncharacterized protein n=1 Tax=Trapa natans TaxID=22666 RepID=A0AAN7L4P6_TRANT|nr:hypothetical protein SAY86_009347 [Trapa natans]